MKKFALSLALLMNMPSFAASSILYDCVGEDESHLVFSEDGLKGEPHIYYSHAGRDDFQSGGNKITIIKQNGKILVKGQLPEHKRFFSFTAVFTCAEVGSQNVQATLNFMDKYSMPLFNPPFDCVVKTLNLVSPIQIN